VEWKDVVLIDSRMDEKRHDNGAGLTAAHWKVHKKPLMTP